MLYLPIFLALVMISVVTCTDRRLCLALSVMSIVMCTDRRLCLALSLMSIVMCTGRLLCCGCFKAVMLHLPIFLALSVMSVFMSTDRGLCWGSFSVILLSCQSPSSSCPGHDACSYVLTDNRVLGLSCLLTKLSSFWRCA